MSARGERRAELRSSTVEPDLEDTAGRTPLADEPPFCGQEFEWARQDLALTAAPRSADRLPAAPPYPRRTAEAPPPVGASDHPASG